MVQDDKTPALGVYSKSGIVLAPDLVGANQQRNIQHIASSEQIIGKMQKKPS
jgi:hypothetical protein